MASSVASVSNGKLESKPLKIKNIVCETNYESNYDED